MNIDLGTCNGITLGNLGTLKKTLAPMDSGEPKQLGRGYVNRILALKFYTRLSGGKPLSKISRVEGDRAAT